MRRPGNDGVLGRRNRAERVRARRGVILETVSITPRTRELYTRQVRKVIHIVEKASSDTNLDDRLSTWVQQRWEKGTPLYKVSATLCGLHFFLPWTKRKLPQCWRLHAVWRRIELPARAPPIPKSFLFSIANFAIQRDDWVFAAMLVLGFCCLLRTGELLSTKLEDLLITDDQGLVRLPKTKTSQRKNAPEVVVFDHPWALCLLRGVLDLEHSLGRSRGLLWLQSAGAFRKRFRSYMRFFKLSHLLFRPYSLRRGGATDMFLQTGSYDLVLEKGRWQSTKVAKVYIQEGLSRLPQLALPQATLDHLLAFAPF